MEPINGSRQRSGKRIFQCGSSGGKTHIVGRLKALIRLGRKGGKHPIGRATPLLMKAACCHGTAAHPLRRNGGATEFDPGGQHAHRNALKAPGSKRIMTTEPTQPQLEQGPPPDNGQVQSQGHRRRRRRRKNKSGQARRRRSQPQAQGQPAPGASPACRRRRHKPSSGSSASTRAAKRRGSSRRVKRLRRSQATASRGRARKAQGKAKGAARLRRSHGPQLSRGQRECCRRAALNHPGGGQRAQQRVLSRGLRAAAGRSPREDAPTRIYCFIEDLFFLAKIQETARKLGVKVEFVKGDKEAAARICDAPENEKPALLVFDLNNLNAKPMALIPKFKSKFKKAVSIIGFLNHLQGDLKLKAHGGGMRRGDAALGLLAEPAGPAPPLRRGRGRGVLANSRV